MDIPEGVCSVCGDTFELVELYHFDSGFICWRCMNHNRRLRFGKTPLRKR